MIWIWLSLTLNDNGWVLMIKVNHGKLKSTLIYELTIVNRCWRWLTNGQPMVVKHCLTLVKHWLTLVNHFFTNGWVMFDHWSNMVEIGWPCLTIVEHGLLLVYNRFTIGWLLVDQWMIDWWNNGWPKVNRLVDQWLTLVDHWLTISFNYG